MTIIHVDPPVLAGAGTSLSAGGDSTASALTALAAGISGVRTGHDLAGLAFGDSYSTSGKALLKAIADIANSCRQLGFGINISSFNYATSNAASVAGGGKNPSALPAAPEKISAPHFSDPTGFSIATPALWYVVEFFVSGIWPSGNPDSMRTAAKQWIIIADALKSESVVVSKSKEIVNSQIIPEAATIVGILQKVGEFFTGLEASCRSLAEALNTFADDVEGAQDAIRDLLSKISPSGILDAVGDLLSGDDPLEFAKEIAHDISEIIHNINRQQEAIQWLFQQALDFVDSIADSCEKWVSKEFPVIAPVVNGFIDIQTGVVHGAADMVGGVISLANVAQAFDDPKAFFEKWGTVAAVVVGASNPILGAGLVAMNPDKAKTLGEAVISKDLWTSDHPLRGLGHNIFDVGTFFLPGVGEAGALGKIGGKIGEVSAKIDSKLGVVGRAGGITGEAGEAANLAARASKFGKEVTDLPKLVVAKTDIPGPLKFDSESKIAAHREPQLPKSHPPEPAAPEPAPPRSQAHPTAEPENSGTPHPEPKAEPVPQPSDGPVSPSPSHDPAPVPAEHPSSEVPDYSGGKSPGLLDDPGIAGEGWKRGEDSAVDPHYGDPVANPGHTKAISDEWVNPELREKVVDPGAPYGRGADGEPYTKVEYDSRYSVLKESGEIWDIYPGNNGAVLGTRLIIDSIDTYIDNFGSFLDRMGGESGAYLAVVEEGVPASFESRALPTKNLGDPYFRYHLTGELPPGWTIDVSQVAPAFGRPGGAIQVLIKNRLGEPVSVNELIKKGILR